MRRCKYGASHAIYSSFKYFLIDDRNEWSEKRHCSSRTSVKNATMRKKTAVFFVTFNPCYLERVKVTKKIMEPYFSAFYVVSMLSFNIYISLFDQKVIITRAGDLARPVYRIETIGKKEGGEA